MLARIAFGVGLLALGYYVGREIGRNESLREELARDRARQGHDAPDDRTGPGDPTPKGDRDRAE